MNWITLDGFDSSAYGGVLELGLGIMLQPRLTLEAQWMLNQENAAVKP